MKLLGLLLIVAVASSNGREININKWIEEILEKANVALRNMGETSLPIKAGKLNDKVSYSDGIILGLDSFKRSGDSTMNHNSTTSTFDIHYGFRFLVAAFHELKIDGKDMSALFRIWDNSIHLAFSVIRINGCRVTLDALKFERACMINFGSSVKEFDSLNVDEFFKSEVLPTFNRYLDGHREAIEISLQFLCKPHVRIDKKEPPYLAFLEQVFYHNKQ